MIEYIIIGGLIGAVVVLCMVVSSNGKKIDRLEEKVKGLEIGEYYKILKERFEEK